MKIDVSIIIVSYNVKEYIISCIESIYKHSKSGIIFEIVIVDNNSIDGSQVSIKNLPYRVKLIENNYNAGFSTAVNQGAKTASGKAILILNPDTLFIEDSLMHFFNKINLNDDIGAIGPALIDENGIVQQSVWRDPSLINTFLSIYHLDFLNFKKNYNYKKFNKTTEVKNISGAAIFMLKKTFKILDGFDEDFFWMEDIDLCARMRKMGYSVLYSPETKIIHFTGKSSRKNYNVKISNQLLSKIKFFKKHHSNRKALILLCLTFVMILMKIVLLFPLSVFSKIKKKKLIAYIFTLKAILNFRLE